MHIRRTVYRTYIRVAACHGFPPGKIGSYEEILAPIVYQIRNSAPVFLSVLHPTAPTCLRFRSSHPSPPLPFLAPSPPNASHQKNRRRPRRLLCWRVQNLPRVPCSSGSHHPLFPDAGHRAVHQLVEKLPEDWRVVVIERNTYVLLSPSPACCRLI